MANPQPPPAKKAAPPAPPAAGAHAAPAAPAPPPNFGRYKDPVLLGKGGMGAVYKAHDAILNRAVAVKTLTNRNPKVLERFRREAQLVARLPHPNIIQIYELIGLEEDTDLSNADPYIVMEFFEGRPLDEALRHGRMGATDLISILRQCGSALERAHAAEVVHRDIKPSNVLMDRAGLVKVVDFGIARALDVQSNLTGQSVLGTPFYMPPEQAMGKPVDHRADIYSLGITAFHMLTGTRPFEAKNRVDVMVMQVKTPLPDIRKLAPDAPEGLVKLIEKMCAKNPSERFQTMTEVLTALEAAAQEVPAAISVETPPARAHTPAKAPAHATPAKKSAAAPAPAPAAATPSRRTPVPAATGILPGPPPGLAPPAAGPSRAPLVLLVVGMLAAVGVGAGAYVMAAGEAGGWQVPDKGWSVDRENALRKVHRNGFGSCAFAPAPIRPDGTFEGLPALAFTPESPIHGRCFLAGPLGAGEMWHELWSDGKLLARVVYEPPPPPEARDFPLDVGGLHAGALAGLASGEHEVAVWLLRPRGEGRAQRLAGGSFTYRKP